MSVEKWYNDGRNALLYTIVYLLIIYKLLGYNLGKQTCG